MAEELIDIVKILDRTQQTYTKILSQATINREEVMKYIYTSTNLAKSASN